MNLDLSDDTRAESRRLREQEQQEEQGQTLALEITLPTGEVARFNLPAGATIGYIKHQLELQ